MATVYLARSTHLGKGDSAGEAKVALKYCHPHLRRDPNFVAMFSDEVRLASLIHHPNVVSIVDVGSRDPLYFAMQYVEGVSLSDWISCAASRGERVQESQLLRVALDVLAGLEAAHTIADGNGTALHLVHRDISPQNILVGVDGVAKISDFGIAKAESRATRTRTGQVKGKSGYMSPEQILLEPVDARSDLWAIGVVLWEALTNRRLFDGDSDAATINLVLSGETPSASSVAGSDPRLDDLLRKAIAFSPADRYPDARAFAEALRSVGIRIADAQQVGQSIQSLFGEKLRKREHSTLSQPHAQARRSMDRSAHKRVGDARWQLGLVVLGLGLGVVWTVYERGRERGRSYDVSPTATSEIPSAATRISVAMPNELLALSATPTLTPAARAVPSAPTTLPAPGTITAAAPAVAATLNPVPRSGASSVVPPHRTPTPLGPSSPPISGTTWAKSRAHASVTPSAAPPTSEPSAPRRTRLQPSEFRPSGL